MILVKGEVKVEGLIYTEKLFVQQQRNFYEKKLVAIADSATVGSPKDLHFVNSAVNQSRMMRPSLCCAWFDEVATIHTNVQYILPYE